MEQRKDKCKGNQGFKVVKRGEDRSLRALVNEGLKHRGNGGKTKGIVQKNKRGDKAGRT